MMTKIRSAKLIVILMALTVGLAGLAVGYAHWQDTIKVDVGITTPVGDFCWGFIQAVTDDPPSAADPTCDSPDCPNNYHSPEYDCDALGNCTPKPGWKNVGTTLTSLAGECCNPEVSGGFCFNAATISVLNGYPSYASKNTITWKNCGLSDVAISREDIVAVPGSGYTFTPGSTWGHGPGSTKCGYLSDDATGKDVLEVCLEDYEGMVYEPGDIRAGIVVLHVLQGAEQNRGRDMDGDGVADTPPYTFQVLVEVQPLSPTLP